MGHGEIVPPPSRQQDNVKWHKDLYVNLAIVKGAGTKGTCTYERSKASQIV